MISKSISLKGTYNIKWMAWLYYNIMWRGCAHKAISDNINRPDYGYMSWKMVLVINIC